MLASPSLKWPRLCLTNEIAAGHFSLVNRSYRVFSKSSNVTGVGDVAEETGVGVPPSASVSSIALVKALLTRITSWVTSFNCYR